MNIWTIGFLAVIYFMLYCAIFWFTVLYEKRKTVNKDPVAKKYPLVSIVIPVYRKDTSEAVQKAVESCVNLSYPKKEIILAWNGPENEVINICRKFDRQGKARLVNTPKKGKAAGMNTALKMLRGDYFCCLDADSFFTKNALENMVGYFEENRVASVTSSMKVNDPKTWLQKVQWIEYIFAIYLRRLMSLIDCIYVVPGPGSMYKTSIVKKLGGFDETSIVEDMEIGFRIQAKKYKIRNSINAIVDTNAPATMKELLNQRLRWYGGFWETLKKYKFMVLNPKYGALGMFMIPNAMIWVSIIIITALKFGWDFFSRAFLNIKSFLLIGFNWELLWRNFIRLLKIEPSYMTVFGLMLVIMAVVTIYLGLKISNEKVAFKSRYQHYFLYFIAYTGLLSFFWLAALGFMLTKKRVGWGG